MLVLAWALGVLGIILAIAWPDLARAADPPASPTAADSSAERLRQAKDLFRKGVTLLDAGDVERALDYFQRSRAAVPSAPNTTNAAICLEELGRYDEALEVYEELLLKFSADLDPEDRKNLGPKMAFLRAKLGAIDLSSNVDGLVVIDRRPRGKLPFSAPVRVIGGDKHVVRVFKDGYESFETTVDVPAGATRALEAKLAPLAGAGLLRVEDPASEGFEVFVDGARVGTIPWEGTVDLGRHVIWTRKGERGSAPSTIVVLRGQTALVRPAAGDLGAPVTIAISPPTAELLLGDVPLGVRAWEGRLPAGAYVITGSEEGYGSERARLIVPPAQAPGVSLRLRLTMDPDHPRWPHAVVGHPFIEAIGGYAAGGTLHADAERLCPAACAEADPRLARFPRSLRDPHDPTVFGGLAAVRGGYRFRMGLAPELVAGYLGLGLRFTRFREASFYSRASQQSYPVAYTLDDRLSLGGPFLGVGGSFRMPIRPPFALVARTTAGILVARVTDPITGTASAGGDRAEIQVEARDQAILSAMPFVLPELGGELATGSFRLGLSLGVGFFPRLGPRFDHPEIGVAPSCSASRPDAVGCAPGSAIAAGERAYGAFSLWLGQVSLGYVF
ncbi:MAG: tetratricopeptide repeat protein [Byssovorax sp.]